MRRVHVSRPSGRPPDSIGKVNQGLLLVMIIVGAVAGYFGVLDHESSDQVSVGRILRDMSNSADPPARSTPVRRELHRFLLSDADVKDTIEAPAMTVTQSGQIVLAWATTTGECQRVVMLVRSSDGGKTFSTPEAVVTTGIHTSIAKIRGREIRRQMRTLPQLASAGEHIYLSWVAAGESRKSVVMQLAESIDGGRRFTKPIAVHRSRDARPTFTALCVTPEKTVACSWLDNRNRVQQPFAALRLPGENGFRKEVMVYAGPDGKGICPCCSTNCFVSGGDVWVTFRGNEAGFRDILASRLEEGASEFYPPKPLTNPTWEFSGCPHDGPSMCETSKGLHVAWMDAHTGAERIYVGRPDSDTRPVAIESSAGVQVSQGHAELIAGGDRIYLVWSESLPQAADSTAYSDRRPEVAAKQDDTSSGHHERSHSEASSGRMIYYATSEDFGVTFTDPVAIAPLAFGFQTRPRIRVSSDGVVFVSWMELTDAGKAVVFARVAVGAQGTPADRVIAGARHGN